MLVRFLHIVSLVILCKFLKYIQHLESWEKFVDYFVSTKKKVKLPGLHWNYKPLNFFMDNMKMLKFSYTEIFDIW